MFELEGDKVVHRRRALFDESLLDGYNGIMECTAVYMHLNLAAHFECMVQNFGVGGIGSSSLIQKDKKKIPLI